MQRRIRLPFIPTLIVACLLGAVPPSGAQTGSASLRQLTESADAVVRARIIAAAAELEAGGQRYPIVHADVLSTLKGAPGPGPIAFANVGASAATFVDGEEVLLFLQHSERVPELAGTPLQAHLRYGAISNGGEIIVLTDASRTRLTDAVRRYAALDGIPDPDRRGEELRLLTLELLKSGDPVVVASVLRDFTLGGDASLLTLADLPALVPLIESSRVPVGTRIAIVAELERRGLIFGPARWVRLLRTSQGFDLLAVIRAVGAHPSAGVNAYLVPVLHGDDLAVATAAATALGVPGNVEVVRALTASLRRPDDGYRTAVIRSIARIGTQSARQALEYIAGRHPDPLLRSAAGTEAIILARRQGTTLAPMLGAGAPDLAAAPALN